MAESQQYFVEKSKLESLQHRLPKDQDSVGVIYEFSFGDENHFVSFANADKLGISLTYEQISEVLSAGLEFAGLYVSSHKDLKHKDVGQICKKHLKALGKILTTSELIVLVLGSADPVLYECDVNTLNLKELPLSITDHNILDRCLLLRLKACLRLDLEYSEKGKVKFQSDLHREIIHLQNKNRCPTTVYHIENSNILFHRDHQRHDNMQCKDILDHITKEGQELDRSKKSKVTDFSKVVIDVEVLSKVTGEEATSKTLPCSLIVNHNHGSYQELSVQLPIDVVVYAHPESPCDVLHELLTEAMNRQLNGMYRCILLHHENHELHTPVPFHFKPRNLGHLVTMLYPGSVDELQLESIRREMHDIFMQPDNAPQFRRLNRHILPDEKVPGGYLINPHIGLPPSGVIDGHVSTVQGLYTYHHYMQDRIDDSGWGCAYRSLQTLVSWLRFQGYTDKDIPNHRQIQQALVDVGDKDHKFVGTKKWIGSTEVSYVLDHLFGITSKIMFVNAGSELETKGRELSLHFESQGSPIMIGGGVLAHTILGVDFDEMTGDIRFLILDPHYTGGEDLKYIQDKGWCGWKGPDFWDKNAYYNLCMPQTPNMI